MRSSGARPREKRRATPPSAGSSARPTRTSWPGSPASWRRSPRSRGDRRDGGTGSSPATAPRRRRRRARRRAGPAPAAGARPAVPRGRGGLGGSPRARPVARRRPVPPDCGSPGAARPRRGDRPRVARDHGAELGWGETRQALEVETISRGAARVRGGAAGAARGAEPATSSTAMEDAARAATVIARHGAGHDAAMPSIGDLPTMSHGLVYEFRIPVAIGSIVAVIVLLVLLARRLGWFAAARRHPGATASCLAVILAVGAPLGWYLGSPIFIRTSLVEPEPAAGRRNRRRRRRASGGASGRHRRPLAAAPSDRDRRRRRADAVLPRRSRAAPSREPTSSISGAGPPRSSRSRPARYHLRLDDFSVRNGPDLYVYLSPNADGYDDGALELGRLKATDGSFGYDLPPAPTRRLPSALIWCKQFSHLFAVAPFGPADAWDRRKSGLCKRGTSAYHPACKRHGSVRGQNVARRKTRTPLTADARNPTGSRRLPRGVSFSCTTTRT